MPRCEVTDLIDGPHPGCAEFAAPAVWQCPKSARVVLVLKHEAAPPWQVRPSRTVWKVCEEHRQEMVDAIAQGLDPGSAVQKEIPLGPPLVA